jgi:hypothetical protein
MKEAKKGGALGFMKGRHALLCKMFRKYDNVLLLGVSKGILGVAVKPVVGVADGVTSIVQGVSSALGSARSADQVRPARPLAWYVLTKVE